MSSPVIKIENLSKQYILNHQAAKGQGSLRDAMTGAVKSVANFLTKQSHQDPEHEPFWALKDINFEIQQGDRVGIIGRNGAGKSTLLKILSRITEPTSGKITIHGRVASLLEVGTGFHAELTGRENIFLNGAILGMSKQEIQRKFDEIVAFAEVEKFLDIPVKRYSSGMYVRLAFAVAAHLEPEILIVDEVLAVGDFEFQKKCLGKMEDISSEHERTVLFVSHNMDMIQRLCNHALVLSQGKILGFDAVDKMIPLYLTQGSSKIMPNEWLSLDEANRRGSSLAKFTSMRFRSDIETLGFMAYKDGPFFLEIEIESKEAVVVGSLSIYLTSRFGILALFADTKAIGLRVNLKPGKQIFIFAIRSLHLNPADYKIGLRMSEVPFALMDEIEDCCELTVIDTIGETFGRNDPSYQAIASCEFKVLAN